MAQWHIPTQPRMLMRRWLSFRTMLLSAAILFLLLTEFRFNWAEAMIGRYLVTTNDARPKSGAIWDQGQQSQLARETLASYMNQRRSAQNEARRATTLGQVMEGLADGEGAMISAAHFIELYLKLPPVLSNELVSPFTLLSQMSGGKWQRVYFDRQAQQLQIYMLDAENQVLHRLSIGTGLQTHIRRGEVAVDGRLEQYADLAAQIYPAERFFAVLNTLPPDVRSGVIANPEDLLRVNGTITRVGIAGNRFMDTIDLGFEVQIGPGPQSGPHPGPPRRRF